jgi:hypothetical protein
VFGAKRKKFDTTAMRVQGEGADPELKVVTTTSTHTTATQHPELQVG